jgi:hypothetical protein
MELFHPFPPFEAFGAAQGFSAVAPVVPFHAEQQTVVRMARIVDSILVDDDGPNQSTELDQRMPIAAVPCKPRCLDGEHGSSLSFADRREQPLEARLADAAARAACTRLTTK